MRSFQTAGRVTGAPPLTLCHMVILVVILRRDGDQHRRHAHHHVHQTLRKATHLFHAYHCYGTACGLPSPKTPADAVANVVNLTKAWGAAFCIEGRTPHREYYPSLALPGSPTPPRRRASAGRNTSTMASATFRVGRARTRAPTPTRRAPPGTPCAFGAYIT